MLLPQPNLVEKAGGSTRQYRRKDEEKLKEIEEGTLALTSITWAMLHLGNFLFDLEKEEQDHCTSIKRGKGVHKAYMCVW